VKKIQDHVRFRQLKNRHCPSNKKSRRDFWHKVDGPTFFRWKHGTRPRSRIAHWCAHLVRTGFHSRRLSFKRHVYRIHALNNWNNYNYTSNISFPCLMIAFYFIFLLHVFGRINVTKFLWPCTTSCPWTRQPWQSESSLWFRSKKSLTSSYLEVSLDFVALN
jgi:hypothetical protein